MSPLSSCYPPFPWPWDPELDRLRRLERETSVEAEKHRLREVLRRRGVPEDVIRGYPFQRPRFPVPCPHRPGLGLADVLALLPRR